MEPKGSLPCSQERDKQGYLIDSVLFSRLSHFILIIVLRYEELMYNDFYHKFIPRNPYFL
jgi:hypothetical protein